MASVQHQPLRLLMKSTRAAHTLGGPMKHSASGGLQELGWVDFGGMGEDVNESDKLQSRRTVHTHTPAFHSTSVF